MPGASDLFADDGPFFAIAGPCVIESAEMVRRVAGRLREISDRLGVPVIFKASYLKDNRTDGSSFRGPGLDEGLRVLAEVRREHGLPVLSDVHGPDEARAAGEVLDVIQIPAFLCRQSSVIEAAAATGRPLNIKKGQFISPASARFVVDKARRAGAAAVAITERGASFGYGDLIVDPRAFAILRDTGARVVYDATHSLQRPGGAETGGDRRFLRPLARAAIAAGAHAVFFETHPDPSRALSDAATQLPLDDAERFLGELWGLARFVRELGEGS